MEERRSRLRNALTGRVSRKFASWAWRDPELRGVRGTQGDHDPITSAIWECGPSAGSPMPIDNNVELGQDIKIAHPSLVNLYGCKVGDQTKIGTFVEIQKNSTIGARCKISSHTFICEGVVIEDEVFVGHGVMFTNDRFPRASNADGSVQTEADWKVEL